MVRSEFMILKVVFAGLLLLWCTICAATPATVFGTVVDKTTGKPAVGDDLALLTIANGSLEVSRGRSSADGSFRLETNVTGPHILRVRHDNVIYTQRVIAGTSVRMSVFDASSNLAGIHGTVSIMRIEAASHRLNITELHSIANDSTPPRTLVNPLNLEVLVPSGAILDSVAVEGPSSRPELVQPKPISTGDAKYAIGYPLRPGKTQFAIHYHLPYSHSVAIHPRLQYTTPLWTVVFPKSIGFRSLGRASFHQIMDQRGMEVQATSNVGPGEVAGFVVSGEVALHPVNVPLSPRAVSSVLAMASHLQPQAPSTTRPTPMSRVSRGTMLAIVGILVALFMGWLAIKQRTSWHWFPTHIRDG